jgi:hypothetical protein
MRMITKMIQPSDLIHLYLPSRSQASYVGGKHGHQVCTFTFRVSVLALNVARHVEQWITQRMEGQDPLPTKN